MKVKSLNFCGDARRRYHVITSIAAASEELRLKKKKDSELKDRNAARTVGSISKESSRNPIAFQRATFLTPTSRPTIIPKETAARGISAVKSEVIQIRGVDININNKKKFNTVTSVPAPTVVHATPKHLPTPIKSEVKGNFQSRWMAVKYLPDTICGADIIDFLTGIKISEIYCHYGGTELMDVYILFESKAGVDAAMLRNGENISSEITLESDNIPGNKLRRKRIQISASLHRVTPSEASWAKALCMRLQITRKDSIKYFELINNSVPQSLLKISPSIADKKWSKVVTNIIIPSYDEICSYGEHQKKLTATSQIHRYDYHDGAGLYPDIHGIHDNFSFCHVSLDTPHSVDIEGINTPLSEESLPIHGVQSVAPRLAEITVILDELSSVLAGELISSYTTLPCTEKFIGNFNPVLDLIHRMSNMYQCIHTKLKNNRYLYTADCNAPGK